VVLTVARLICSFYWAGLSFRFCWHCCICHWCAAWKSFWCVPCSVVSWKRNVCCLSAATLLGECVFGFG